MHMYTHSHVHVDTHTHTHTYAHAYMYIHKNICNAHCHCPTDDHVLLHNRQILTNYPPPPHHPPTHTHIFGIDFNDNMHAGLSWKISNKHNIATGSWVQFQLSFFAFLPKTLTFSFFLCSTCFGIYLFFVCVFGMGGGGRGCQSLTHFWQAACGVILGDFVLRCPNQMKVYVELHSEPFFASVCSIGLTYLHRQVFDISRPKTWSFHALIVVWEILLTVRQERLICYLEVTAMNQLLA